MVLLPLTLRRLRALLVAGCRVILLLSILRLLRVLLVAGCRAVLLPILRLPRLFFGPG
ncbi:hypothetical protein OHQ89_24415 [Streptomyces canus]|uniref:hypothetical protein n=1 Tax=Streptomyces canus TaxID=58343 RepID=UPI0030E04A91